MGPAGLQALSRLHKFAPTWKLCHMIPKVDLHAHLNGSLRRSTVMELVQRNGLGPSAERIVLESGRSLAACFQLFPVLHRCVTDPATVRRVAREAVEDFAAENVAYLELRTTPRAEPESRMSAEDYVDAVLHGVQDAIDELPNCIDVGVILSINRTMRPDDAQRVLDLALRYAPITARVNPSEDAGPRGPTVKAPRRVRAAARTASSGVHSGEYSLPILPSASASDAARLRSHEHASASSHARPQSGDAYSHEANPVIAPWGPTVVGIDFSGNPTVNSFADFRDVFESARDAGLRTCVHFAEVDDEDDTNEVLSFGPDRVGHACHMKPHHLHSLRRQQIPVEVCATSNARTLQLAQLHCHPTLGALLGHGHPLSVCTDDRGVFSTSATREIALVADTFNLSAARVVDIALSSAEHGFMGGAALRRVQRRMAHGLLHALEHNAPSLPEHTPANSAAAVRDEMSLHAARAAVASALPSTDRRQMPPVHDRPADAASHLSLVHSGGRGGLNSWSQPLGKGQT